MHALGFVLDVLTFQLKLEFFMVGLGEWDYYIGIGFGDTLEFRYRYRRYF